MKHPLLLLNTSEHACYMLFDSFRDVLYRSVLHFRSFICVKFLQRSKELLFSRIISGFPSLHRHREVKAIHFALIFHTRRMGNEGFVSVTCIVTTTVSCVLTGFFRQFSNQEQLAVSFFNLCVCHDNGSFLPMKAKQMVLGEAPHGIGLFMAQPFRSHLLASYCTEFVYFFPVELLLLFEIIIVHFLHLIAFVNNIKVEKFQLHVQSSACVNQCN
nr:MAG TPA: hypothetical protein [Bacteriophage sp.]